jgi:hypothetical protein
VTERNGAPTNSPFDKLRVRGGANGILKQSLILSLSKDEGFAEASERHPRHQLELGLDLVRWLAFGEALLARVVHRQQLACHA